jgi:hypothetical protein
MFQHSVATALRQKDRYYEEDWKHLVKIFRATGK